MLSQEEAKLLDTISRSYYNIKTELAIIMYKQCFERSSLKPNEIRENEDRMLSHRDMCAMLEQDAYNIYYPNNTTKHETTDAMAKETMKRRTIDELEADIVQLTNELIIIYDLISCMPIKRMLYLIREELKQKS